MLILRESVLEIPIGSGRFHNHYASSKWRLSLPKIKEKIEPDHAIRRVVNEERGRSKHSADASSVVKDIVRIRQICRPIAKQKLAQAGKGSNCLFLLFYNFRCYFGTAQDGTTFAFF
jgi:hypothetical protein